MQNCKNSNIFFAAANGYTGFRSYFDEVFPSAEFSKILVLKGGPGTGKSSFMKKLLTDLSSEQISSEVILCSSDPKSLDGVIFESANGRVGVLDGTAPHARDAKVPGAVDEIVNLGEGFRQDFLRAQRDRILSLSEQKADAYKTAYDYLAISGKCEKFIDNLKLSSCELPPVLKEIAEEQKSKEKRKTRLVSSFGKSGLYRLNTLEKISKKIYTVRGGSSTCNALISALSAHLAVSGKAHVFCPSALDHQSTEAIFLPDSKVTVTLIDGGEVIDANAYFAPQSPVRNEEARVARSLSHDAREEAARWFSVASELHFSLEEIYTGAMDFEKIDRIYESKRDEIKNILGLSS